MKECLLNDGHKAIYRTPGFGPTALFCPTVGNINGGAWKFCSACGKPLFAIEDEQTCPFCGKGTIRMIGPNVGVCSNQANHTFTPEKERGPVRIPTCAASGRPRNLGSCCWTYVFNSKGEQSITQCPHCDRDDFNDYNRLVKQDRQIAKLTVEVRELRAAQEAPRFSPG